MLRVRCPQCNKIANVIDGKCQECGYGTIEYMTSIGLVENGTPITDRLYICPHCGTIDAGQTLRLKCDECNTPYKAVELTREEYYDGIYICDKEVALLEKYVGDTIDWDIYNEREEKWNQRMEKEHQQRETQQANVPKCPTCSSTNIKKVSTTSKVVNVGLFGLFGNKRKMQFHCNNCGYEW